VEHRRSGVCVFIPANGVDRCSTIFNWGLYFVRAHHELDSTAPLPDYYYYPHGLNLSITQSSLSTPSLVYTKRSCSLPFLPCQNSTITGLTLNPSQPSGTGILSTPSNRSSYSLTLSSSWSRSSKVSLWRLARRRSCFLSGGCRNTLEFPDGRGARRGPRRGPGAPARAKRR
jgi:hypothetical protein